MRAVEAATRDARPRPLLRAAVTGVAVPARWALQRAGLESRWYRWLSRRAAARLGERGEVFAGYRAGRDDVFVACWIKSGTSWMLQIATQIAWRAHGDFAHIHQVVPWPDSPVPFAVDLADAQAAPATGLRVIKTHLPADCVPWDDAARYISVIRDPADVFVSSWHFFRDFLLGPLMPSPRAWLDLFCSREFLFGTWPAHVAGWWRLRDRPNVLVTGFADLKRDLAAGVDLVARLLAVPLTAQERDAVIARAAFAAMQADDQRFRPPTSLLTTPSARMLRRGDVGVAGELLDGEGRRRIDRWCRAELDRLGSDFPYDRWFGRSPA